MFIQKRRAVKSGWRNCGSPSHQCSHISPVCHVGLDWSVIITGCDLLGVKSTYANTKYFKMWHNEGEYGFMLFLLAWVYCFKITVVLLPKKTTWLPAAASKVNHSNDSCIPLDGLLALLRSIEITSNTNYKCVLDLLHINKGSEALCNILVQWKHAFCGWDELLVKY